MLFNFKVSGRKKTKRGYHAKFGSGWSFLEKANSSATANNSPAS